MFSLFVAAIMLSSTSSSVLDCAPANSLFKLTSMTFSPDPAIPGQNSTLALSMNIPEQVSNGLVTYGLTYNFIPFSPTTENLCDAVACPILPGILTTRSSYPIDRSLSGTIQIKINWKDNSSRDLMCVNVRTKIGPAAKQLLTYSDKPMLPLPMCPLYPNMTYKGLLRAYKRKVKKELKNITNETKTKLRGKA